MQDCVIAAYHARVQHTAISVDAALVHSVRNVCNTTLRPMTNDQIDHECKCHARKEKKKNMEGILCSIFCTL